MSCDQTPSPDLLAERILLSHPAVQQALFLRETAGAPIALVVPRDSWIDEALDRHRADEAVLRRWQKTYDLTQSSPAADAAPVGFNTISWDSSYTRRPISAEQMREWVQTTVASILDLAPRSVCEIGCGTGMLLFGIAPECHRYAAADFSSGVLRRVREQLEMLPSLSPRVELFERRADQLGDFPQDGFDTVVLNSVVQYFPGTAYLLRVLENAARLVSPGGHIFVGDVRSLSLLPAFAASVELFQAEDAASLDDIRDRARNRIRRTPELVLSPTFFLSLPRRIPRIGRVEIRLRAGRADNEMSRFRYNAILHVGPECEPPVNVPFEECPAGDRSLAAIRARFLEAREPFALCRIPNLRVERDLEALARLISSGPGATAGNLRRELDARPACGLHPQELLDLESAVPGSQVLLSWAASRTDGSFDAVFLPNRGIAKGGVDMPAPEPAALLHLASTPGQAAVRAKLVESLSASVHGPIVPECERMRIELVDALPPPSGRDGLAAFIARHSF
ncbi:MAG TPA: class I SAM-dependent methyltransferase [Acidobacteriaceae bacterium]|jgi:ubiquinone/menaquinone biosynthesis C-methylase UbiE|nr:class I SAM-dependent methyltransferase [Acidobacteriaceae bacterium]